MSSMSRILSFFVVVLAGAPLAVPASVVKPGQLPVEAKLQFDRLPRPGETVTLNYEVTASAEVHGLAIALRFLSPVSTPPTEWLDGLTSEVQVLEAPVPWKGDLAAGAHATLKAKLIFPAAGVYHIHGSVPAKGVTLGGGTKGDPLGFYDVASDLWVRVGADRTVVTPGESIGWTRQWNSTFSTAHGDDIPDSPVALSLVFEKLPTLAAEGVLLIRVEAREEIPGLALDFEVPAAGLAVPAVATPSTRRASGPVTVEPGGPIFDVRWQGGLEPGEAATLRVPVRVVKAGWDVLRLYASGTRAAGRPGWATHKELIMAADEVVTAAKERVLPAGK